MSHRRVRIRRSRPGTAAQATNGGSGIVETTRISAFGPKPNYAQIWYDDGL